MLSQYRSRGFAADLGLLSVVNPRLSFGLSLVDFGVAEAYDTNPDPLPSLLRMAVKGVLLDSGEVQLNLAAELDRPLLPSDPIYANGGLEYWYARKVAFRAGYRLGADLGGFSMGTGFRWRGLEFDYAYTAFGDLGLAHRFSLSTELGAFFDRAKASGGTRHARM